MPSNRVESPPPRDLARPVPFRMELRLLVLCAAFECGLLAFLEKGTRCLSNFQARKLCHAGTGLMLLQLDSRDEHTRYFVYMIGLGSLALTWEVHPKLKPFRFGKARDIGMTVYLLVMLLWFSLSLPIHVLGPMFFADPMGAVVGKYLSSMKDKGVVNPVWWSRGGVTKTIGGSAAVLVFTMITFAGPATIPERLLVGIVAVLAEAIGGAYDNLLLVLVIVGFRMVLNNMQFGSFALRHDGPMVHGASDLVIGPVPQKA
ncbi:hypothetical protein AK812_SmicGene8026 [Symbiodinium microadriaticum]|uniref:Uncharacterized protein n=1 Tax=Symbiodinium microadriaticum TaxID=2951 RepID=A0A1Q9EM15_SYMMI|nr:hypothetical protein AK812_SmicGene8026 [Symbiodinium microadriaticum]